MQMMFTFSFFISTCVGYMLELSLLPQVFEYIMCYRIVLSYNKTYGSSRIMIFS